MRSRPPPFKSNVQPGGIKPVFEGQGKNSLIGSDSQFLYDWLLSAKKKRENSSLCILLLIHNWNFCLSWNSEINKYIYKRWRNNFFLSKREILITLMIIMTGKYNFIAALENFRSIYCILMIENNFLLKITTFYYFKK